MARDNFDNEAFTADYFAQYDSTISNGEARIPICFCIDTSSSMNFVTNKRSDYRIIENSSHTEDGIDNVVTVEPLPGVTLHHRIDEVQRVLNHMLERMRYDRRISNAAVISIVTFDMFADCIVEFSEAGRISPATIRSIRTHEDKTNASKGIQMALERLDQFRRVNSMAGNESYKPVLIFMSDGDVNNDPGAAAASREVRERSDAGTLNVIPIAIGGAADETWMRRLSKDAHVFHMEHEEEFDRVFDIITRRIAKTTMVISVDEGLKSNAEEDNLTDVPSEPDESSTRYGTDTTDDEFMSFLNSFANS